METRLSTAVTPRTVVAIDVNSKRNWSEARIKRKAVLRGRTDPAADVADVGERRRHGDDTAQRQLERCQGLPYAYIARPAISPHATRWPVPVAGSLGVRDDVHASNNRLEHSAAVVAEEVDLHASAQ